jgi:hypothetical protein
MSLHQKQYSEPEAIEVDSAVLHRHIQQLRDALIVMRQQYMLNASSDLVGRSTLGLVDRALEATKRLYFPT